MTDVEEKRIREIADKYSKYGFTFGDILQILIISKDTFDEMQEKRLRKKRFIGALTLARMFLAKTCGENENFTVDEIADTYGIGRDEVVAWAESKGVLNNIHFGNIKDGD